MAKSKIYKYKMRKATKISASKNDIFGTKKTTAAKKATTNKPAKPKAPHKTKTAGITKPVGGKKSESIKRINNMLNPKPDKKIKMTPPEDHPFSGAEKIKIKPAVTPAKKSSRTMVLRDVYAKTPQKYKDRAKYAKLRNFKVRVDNSGDQQTAPDVGRRVVLSECYTTHDANGNPKKESIAHYQFVIGYSKKLSDQLWPNKCKVSCSCEDFLFTDEVALHKRGNADVYFSNGENPVIKNPEMKPQICKHLIKVLQEIHKRAL